MSQVSGYRLAETAGRNFFATFIAPQQQQQARLRFQRCLQGDVLDKQNFFMVTQRGYLVQVEWQDHLRQDDQGRILGVLLIGKDLSDPNRKENRLVANQKKSAYVPYYDAVTGLPNRILCFERLQQAIERTQADSMPALSLMWLDVDAFSKVTTSVGQEHADQLLCTLATRLEALIQGHATWGRLDEDTFFLLLEDISDPQQLASLAQKLLTAVGEPLHVHQQELSLSATIGIAVYPQDGEDAETLLGHAEAAMWRGKAQGGNTYQFFTQEQD